MDTQAWARASLGSREQATITTTAAEEKTASQEARLQNMCPVRENKLSEKTTYLWAVCSSAISTSQGPKMDSASFNCLSLWLTLKEMFLPSLSLTHTHTSSLPTSTSSHPLLPRVIKYANDLCWACRGDCSHSNSTARKHTGGVHYTACSLKLRPAAEHICPLVVALSESPDEGRRANRDRCPTFLWPCFLYSRAVVSLSRRVSRRKLWNLVTCWLSTNYSWAN